MSKLEILIRQNKKKNEIGNCKNQLTNILRVQINEEDFMPLEQSDLIVSKFYHSYKNSDKKCCTFLSTDSKSLDNFIKVQCTDFIRKNCYLISKQTEICGLIILPFITIFEKYKEMIQLDGDSLCCLSIDESEGIYVDYYEETNELNSSWYYEVCYWNL